MAVFFGAFIVYWKNFQVFKKRYSDISERIEGHIRNRTDNSPSPGHTYAIASRGPSHARDAELQSADARWRQLSMAFPHLDNASDKRPLVLVTRDYTEISQVNEMQKWLNARISGHVRRAGRDVVTPEWIHEQGDNFDALRNPQLAIANPAIYTFPFFLTWQRRHQWGVLPYGVHNRLGVVCSPRHPQLATLREIETQYGAALAEARADRVALWVNEPRHARWLTLLLGEVLPPPKGASIVAGSHTTASLLSVGAYLHKELLPLACAVVSDSQAGARYAERAQEVEVTDLAGLIAGGPTGWPDASAIIVDLAVLPSDLPQSGWEVLKLAHCVYVPIGIGYSVAAVPILLDGSDWAHDMLKDVGEALLPASIRLANIGIELDERLWTAS